MTDADRRKSKIAGKRLAMLRTARSELKNKIKAGEINGFTVLKGEAGSQCEELVRTMRVLDICKALPGVGETIAHEAMFELRISPIMRMQGTTIALRTELAQLLFEATGGAGQV